MILVRFIHRMVLKTKSDWDDFLLRRKVFTALSHLPSAFIFYFTYNFSEIKIVDEILLRVSLIYFVVIVSMVLNRLVRAGLDIYHTTPYAQNRSIKGYAQLLHILIYFVAAIFIISFIAGKSPLYLLTGLGAIAAVLLLVFKDTILGFVASIQLSANNMVKPGDWIQMPGHNADGTVIDISLNTVKVQNWDKTITTIPTYALVSESFNNWKGMEESGGRRIKRSIGIDMKSVKFCDSALLEKFKKFRLIRDYVEKKQDEITAFNKSLNIDEHDTFNGRRQTNLGIFRKYLEAYLRNHPMISQEMTFLVRHLQPTEKGLPLEIYVFSKEQRWPDYESIQADIFDHVLAVIPEFDLKVFQNPSGNDIAEFIKKQ
jgi:miniconductance mechanosensitive channel